MDVINAAEKQPTVANPTASIHTDDGLSGKTVTEIERVEQQSDQFNGIQRVASLFIHHSRCCNVYLDEMVARLTSECVASKSELKQQHEIIQELQKQLKTLSDIHRMNPQTFSDEGQQFHQAQVEEEPTVEVTDRTPLVINKTVTTNEPSSPSDSFHAEQPDEIESAQASTDEFTEGSVIVPQPNDEMEQEPTAEVSQHVTQLEISEIGTMNEQPFLSDSGQMDQLQANESVQSYVEECNERNVAVQTFSDEGQQLHQAQVEEEPTVEVTDRTPLVINKTVTTNEPSSPSDSFHAEQPDEIESAKSRTDEFNEGSVIVTQSNDKVSLNAEQHDESEEVVQSGHSTQLWHSDSSLRMKQLRMVNPTTRILTDDGSPDKTITEIENLEHQPKEFNDVANHSTYLDEMVAKLATESVTLKTQVKQQHEMILRWEKQLRTIIGIRRMNHPTFLGEGNQIHLTNVVHEPTVEVSHQTQLEIDEIDTMNEQSFLSGSGQIEQFQAIESVQSNAEECNERSVIVRRSSDDVSLDVGQLNESEEAVQSGYFLRTQIPFGLRKRDGKQITYSLRSTDTSHQNPRNCSKRSKNHTCGECKKRFNRKSHLVIHLRVHSGERPFKCKECIAAFKHANTLKAHQRIHSGEKPYKCKDCNSAFSVSNNLTSHQRIHSGEKPYKCKDCNSAFRQSNTLKAHQRIHSGEKPFMCDICKKSFRHKNHLLLHMDTHRGKTSHKCNVCQKEFRFRSNLRNHLKIHGTTLKKFSMQ